MALKIKLLSFIKSNLFRHTSPTAGVKELNILFFGTQDISHYKSKRKLAHKGLYVVKLLVPFWKIKKLLVKNNKIKVFICQIQKSWMLVNSQKLLGHFGIQQYIVYIYIYIYVRDYMYSLYVQHMYSLYVQPMYSLYVQPM